MSLQSIVNQIGKQNIAVGIDKDVLSQLGDRVKRQHDEDLKSMSEWSDMVKEGINLMKQEYKSKSTPWEGASNFKSPMLTEASLSFGNKAKLELLRGNKLVKGAVIGRDPEQKKKQRLDRVTEVMNYQINYQMPDWREDQKRLYYAIPNSGTIFKVTNFNPLEMTNESQLVQYPNFVVNQATTSMNKCRSFTIYRDFCKDEVEQRKRSGMWSKDVEIYGDDEDGDRGSNEREGVKSAESNSNRFFEQHTYADLDGDGIEEPYIVTIHESTSQVVRIVARYDMGSIIVSRNGRVMPLNKMIIKQVREAAESGLSIPEDPDLSEMAMVKVTAINNITKYEFIPSPDGTFLGLGYSHLLGAITQAVNSTTNQLVDAGTLRNLGGGFMARSVRKKMGPLKMKIGEWISTELSPENLANGFFPNPSPEPSQVLFALNEKLEGLGRNFAAASDAGGQIAANTAATTALAIIQENLVPTSALMSSMLDSSSKEFQIMFRLNQTFFQPELYREILDDPNASAFADFNSEDMDILPTGNADMASKMQRIQIATVELEQFDRLVQVGANAKEVLRRFYEAIGTQDIDNIFDESTMTPEEKAQTEQLQQQQKMLVEQQQEQINLTRAQVQLAAGELERLNFRTSAEVEKLIAETDKIAAQVSEVESNIILNLEKAETEDVKNGVQQYTAMIKTLVDASSKIRDLTETKEAQNGLFATRTTPASNTGSIQEVA